MKSVNNFDDAFLNLVRLIRDTGVVKSDRTGTGTKSIFGHQMRFNLAEGFPLLTAKKTHLKSIIHELLWFLQGETNVRYLKENGVSIWDEWCLPGTAEYIDLTLKERSALVAKKGQEVLDKWVEHIRELRGDFIEGMVELTDEITEKHHLFLDSLDIPRRKLVAGELGPVYGAQWRNWPAPNGESIDQITKLVEMLKRSPDSRRLLVSAWNPALVDEMALPPCHTMFQFYCAPLSGNERWKLMDKKGIYISFCNTPTEEELHRIADEHDIPKQRLSCQLYQRKLNCAFAA